MIARKPEGPREACGVFGVFARDLDVARVTFFGLTALQHRGQESAGIATTDGHIADLHRGMGLVTQVFNEGDLAGLRGHIAIGHTRYSTTGASHLRNAQPCLTQTPHGPLAIAHNGNLTNAAALRQRLLDRGVKLNTTTDSELILWMLAAPTPGERTPCWPDRIAAFMREAEGAWSLAILTGDALYAVRDPLGLRPLCLGALDLGGGRQGTLVASESCALTTVGGHLIRDVAPGEIVRIDADGARTAGRAEARRPAMCVFEYVYVARPDSLLESQPVHAVRARMGELLADEAPADADVVIAVPDSATHAALGFARASGIPFIEGLIKNRYIGRTFIQPDAHLRGHRARLKYNPLVANVAGRRVALVDDSIVRGNTAGLVVQLLRDAGATEVHFRVASPPIRHPCFMGVDMGTRVELLAHQRSPEAIRDLIGADTLAFLSQQAMMRAVSERQPAPPTGLSTSSGSPTSLASGHCAACFDGHYPLDIRRDQPLDGHKLAFEVDPQERAP